MCRTMPGFVERYTADPGRRAGNASSAPFDFLGYAWACLSQLAYMSVVSWGHDRDVFMLAVGASFAVTTGTLAFLVARRHALYVRWREPLALLGALHFSVSDVTETLRSQDCYVEHHSGSTLRLLGLTVIHNPALLLALYSVYGRMPLAWSLGAQPLLAMYPIIQGRALCSRALDTPGTPALMAQLHRRLGLLFGAPVMPLWAVLHAVPSPMAGCLAVNCFSVLMLVVVLPLFALAAFERRRRRVLAAAQQRLVEQQQRSALEARQRRQWWMWWPDDSSGGGRGGGSSSGAHMQRHGSHEPARQGSSGGQQRRQRRQRRGYSSFEDSEMSSEGLEDDAGEEASKEAIPRPMEGVLHLYLCSSLAWAGSVWLAIYLT